MGDPTNRNFTWKWKGEEISVVKDYTFLEVCFSSGGLFNKHIGKQSRDKDGKGHESTVGNLNTKEVPAVAGRRRCCCLKL